jgi:hypothetical protein
MKIEAQARLKAASTKVCGCVTASCEHDAALTEKQKKLDINQDGKIDGDDLKKVREGELVEAATPQEAAKFVVKVFNKNGLKIKFSGEGRSGNTLMFSLIALGGIETEFELILSGKKVTVDTSSSVFDPRAAMARYVGTRDPKAPPFSKLGSRAFDKWEASTDKLVEQVGDFLRKYQSFVERFNTAISEITAEMQKGKK